MKIIKMFPDRIQLKTNEEEFRDIRLNDLLSVSDGEVELVTMITAITDTDVEEPIPDDAFLAELRQPSLKVIECSILGSVVDGEFKQRLDKYPNTDAEIKKMRERSVTDILWDHSKGMFHLGHYSAYPGAAAWVDGNRFYQRHSCVVGNTGSGKSETLAKILGETARLPGANMILFDIHGEYGGLSYVDNIRIGDDTPFPVWLFGFQDMVSNILKIKDESATVVMSALRRCYKKCCPKGNEGKAITFSYDSIMEEMDRLDNETILDGYFKNGEPKIKNGEYNGKLTNVVNLMRAKRHDVRYSFLFGEHSQDCLNRLINRFMGGDKPVKNIDLSGVPHDVAIPVIGAVTKLVFDIQRGMGSGFCPITLACDEAHIYIPNNFQLSASERRMVEVFENIAKEGRKFGLTLLVASQRPSELNKTIMAQCANFIVGKLNNENDKAMIKAMLPSGSESVIDSTAMFSPGDVLVVGDAAPIPLKIHVELARERPRSRTIDFWDEWSGSERVSDYSEQVERYLED